MFRSNFTRAFAFATLTLVSLSLVFASGCTSNVVGPAHRAVSAPQPRVPAELSGAEKAGVTPVLNPSLPGDITGDGYVDASDLAAFAFLMRADVTNDGIVDDQDAAVLAGALNHQVPDLAAPAQVIDASDYAAFAAALSRSDLTMDGHVDASDLAALAWMRARGDLDGDGVVSRRDRNIIAPEFVP